MAPSLRDILNGYKLTWVLLIIQQNNYIPTSPDGRETRISNYILTVWSMGGSPGLVVMRGDSCSKGTEFESRHSILDGHFFTCLFVEKFVMCVWKDEKNRKSGRVGPFKNQFKAWSKQ